MKATATTLILCLVCGPVWGNQIRSACLGSERGQGEAVLCTCIQDAADLTLTTRDQRRASAFFDNPDRAQSVRQSNRRQDEEFWGRYRNFSDMAEALCGR